MLERRIAQYDKAGEQHYNLMSALHKSVRGSDPDAALYWFARMVEGGEDLLYVARRVVRMAVEDIGSRTRAASRSRSRPRTPTTSWARPKAISRSRKRSSISRRRRNRTASTALGARRQRAARDHPAEPVPLHIRNAPTKLMKDIGYGDGYRYDHAEGGHAAGQEYLPDALRGARWYEPGSVGLRENDRRAPRLVAPAQKRNLS